MIHDTPVLSCIKEPLSTSTPYDTKLTTNNGVTDTFDDTTRAYFSEGTAKGQAENIFNQSSPSTVTFIDSISSDTLSGSQPLSTDDPHYVWTRGASSNPFRSPSAVRRCPGRIPSSFAFIWEQAAQVIGDIPSKGFILELITLLLRQFVHLIFKVGICLIYWAGFGRHSKSCLTIQQFLWLRINSVIMDSWTNWPQNPQALRLKPCDILHKQRGEPLLIWDAFQELLFLSSRGAFIAERQGVITKDGHLLIMHRLRRVPQHIRDRLVRLGDITLVNAFIFAIQTIWERIWEQKSDFDANLSEDIQVSDSSRECFESRNRDGEVQLVIFQHGLFESSLNWIMNCAVEYPDQIHNIDRSTGQNRPIYYSKAGQLLKSGVNELLMILWKSILKPAVRELTSLSVAVSRILQGRRPVPCRGEKTIDIKRLRNSLPLRLMLDEFQSNSGGRLEFDLWLTNTRGNAFSDPVFLDSATHYPPMGYRETSVNEMVKTNAIQNQEWTHHDMALLDIEAIFEKICIFQNKYNSRPATPDNSLSYGITNQNPIQPIIVAFSQGSAMFLLNTAYRKLILDGTLPFMDISPVKLKGMILISPPLVLKRNGQSMPEDWVPTGSVNVTGVARRSSSAESSSNEPPFLSAFSNTDELVELELDNRTPFSNENEESIWNLNHLEENARMVNQLTGWRKVMKGDFSMTGIFFFLVWRYTSIVTMTVESLIALIPSGFMAYAELFVRHGLRFHVGKLKTGCAKWFYKFTPNGTTSPSNLKLWQDRMESGEPLGNRFLQSTNCLKHIYDLDTLKRIDCLPVLALGAETCPLHIVLGLDDSITDTLKSVRLIQSQCPGMTVDYVPKDQTVRTSDNQVGNAPSGFRCPCRTKGWTTKEGSNQGEVAVKMLQGISHLDMIWPEANFTNIQQGILKCISNWSNG